MAFDFTKLYKAYPRHEGKVPGMRILQKIIKSNEDYQRFERAVSNYALMCLREKKETKFILLWSTFCNGRWEDYIEMERPLTQMERIELGAL